MAANPVAWFTFVVAEPKGSPVVDVGDASRAVSSLLKAMRLDCDEYDSETPGRVARAWEEALSGYEEDPAGHLKRRYPVPLQDPGLVVVAGVRFASTCAHHLLPIIGTASVGYRPAPGQRVVGLSKLARVVQTYARRLQLQERLGQQVVTVIQEELCPVGAGCVITASHACMSWRGVNDQDVVTTTRALMGDWTESSGDVAMLASEHRAFIRSGSAG